NGSGARSTSSHHGPGSQRLQEKESGRNSWSTVDASLDHRASPRRRRSHSGCLVSADKRSGYDGHCSTTGSMLLLALAYRELFQTSQVARPAIGMLAPRNRTRYLPPAVDRDHGMCDRMATN